MAGPQLSTANTPNENTNTSIGTAGFDFPYAPSSSTANALVAFADTTGGRLINTSVLVDANGNLIGSKKSVLTGATVLTAAQSGSLCVWNAAAGYLFTLPAPAIGLEFTFLVGVTCTSVGNKVITNTGTVFINGGITSAIANTTPGANPGPKVFTADGSTIVAINMFGVSSDTTTGGVCGSRFTLTCTSATEWTITGSIIATGTIATPFATS